MPPEAEDLCESQDIQDYTESLCHKTVTINNNNIVHKGGTEVVAR